MFELPNVRNLSDEGKLFHATYPVIPLVPNSIIVHGTSIPPDVEDWSMAWPARRTETGIRTLEIYSAQRHLTEAESVFYAKSD